MRETIDQLLAGARQDRSAGRAAEAAAGYARAADLARSAGEDLLLAHALRHVSDLAGERGDSASALSAGREAVEIYRAKADSSPLDLANALRVAALAWREMAKPDEAIPLWREARELYDREGVLAGVRECDDNLRSSPRRRPPV